MGITPIDKIPRHDRPRILAGLREIWGVDSRQYRAAMLRSAGLTYRRIADRLGCSVSAAYYAVNVEAESRKLRRERQRYHARIQRRRDARWTAFQVAGRVAKCLTEFNWSIDKTAAELRLTVAQVQAIVDAGFHVPGVHYDARVGWYVE